MSNNLFDASFFKGNRERLRSLFTGTAPIVLTANGLLQRNSDSTFPFRQDSNFWYLTGLEDPDLILVIDKHKEYLIVPGRSDSREAFDGQLDVEAFRECSGIEDILDEKTGWKQLDSRLKKVHHVAVLAAPTEYVETHGMYTNPSRRRLATRIQKSNDSLELLDLRPHLTRMRSIKQPQELAAIKTAIQVTATTLKKLHRKGFDKFDYEYEVEAAISAGFRKSNAQHAYAPIVAAGANACTLHYVTNNAAMTTGDLVLLDVGAEISNYAADITRTYAASEPTKRQLQVWEAVIDVQKYATELLKPGVIMHDYEKQIEHYMGEKLRELGLIKVIEHDAVRTYYPHATSHFLGLDVHDIGDYDRPLEAGMVLTVEPGIYIPEEGIGIRIEDDILITEQGAEVLSAGLPRELY